MVYASSFGRLVKLRYEKMQWKNGKNSRERVVHEVWVNPEHIVSVFPESKNVWLVGGSYYELTDESFEALARLYGIDIDDVAGADR